MIDKKKQKKYKTSEQNGIEREVKKLIIQR